jgi:hypothetical protein
MKNSTIVKMTLTLAIIVLGYANSWGQNELPLPTGFHQHGKNSLDVVTPAENRDSVTVGASMKYYVEPDAAISGTNSTFAWSLKTPLGTVTPTSTNIATISFGTVLGVDTIKVRETSPTASCPGSISKIPIELIAAPTGEFNDADYVDGVCVAVADSGTYTYAVPLSLNTSVKDDSIRLSVTVTRPDLTTRSLIIKVKKTATSFTYGDYPSFGAYTFKITAVTDRISRKSNVAGTITTGKDVFTLAFNKVPQTGPIYHLPNN